MVAPLNLHIVVVVGYDNLQKSFVRRLCNVHAVSYFVCGVIDTVCILYIFFFA
jgi:hypothetical protein